MAAVPNIKLNNGRLIPQVGLGTFQSSEADVRQVVLEAIRIGYRHIDTAYGYENEREVGLGIADAIQEGLVSRSELFVVSKLPKDGHSTERVPYFLKKSLELLNLDYLDLYLVHSPIHLKPIEEGGDPKDPQPDPKADFVKTWKGMEDCVNTGLTKSIGLSNFNSVQIQKIYDSASIKPANLQVECHAYFAQNDLFNLCKKLDITMTAYAPLGAPFLTEFVRNKGMEYPELPVVMKDPAILPIAQAHSKTPAQVLLRWLLQRGIIIIPKSKSISRVKENFQIFDFDLNQKEMEIINKLDRNQRFFSMTHLYDGVLDHPDYPFHIPF